MNHSVIATPAKMPGEAIQFGLRDPLDCRVATLLAMTVG